MTENKTSDLNEYIQAAQFKIEQKMLDAARPSARLVITVHGQGNSSIGNVFYYDGEDINPTRYIEERKIQCVPDVTILMGEVSRLANKIQTNGNKDPRFSMATESLMVQALRLVDGL